MLIISISLGIAGAVIGYGYASLLRRKRGSSGATATVIGGIIGSIATLLGFYQLGIIDAYDFLAFWIGIILGFILNVLRKIEWKKVKSVEDFVGEFKKSAPEVFVPPTGPPTGPGPAPGPGVGPGPVH